METKELIAGGALALGLLACSGGGDGKQQREEIPGGAEIRIRGLVSRVTDEGAGGPLGGATVTVSVDHDGDGTISAAERVEVKSGADGAYELTARAAPGSHAVISFADSGHAPVFRRIHVDTRTDTVLNATLFPTAPLTCQGGSCALAGRTLSIRGLDEGVRGAARVFNPVTETRQFPGGFDDADGNLLVSGVFAAVELRDGDGKPLHRLGREVELRMQIPRETWPVLIDLHPGNDRIDLPLYAFDEVQGTWVRHGKDGWAEDGEGNVLPESAAEQIRDGSFGGALFVAGEVDHFSYWNLDWPIPTHACFVGNLRDALGQPAEGATVIATGRTYTGESAAQTVDASGRFRLTVMRSERSGEDLDQDGVPGETHRVSLRAFLGGKSYDLGTFDAPARDSSEECADLGSLDLGHDHELQVGLCTLTGTVVDGVGLPLVGAQVSAFDPAVPEKAYEELCGPFYENCDIAVASDDRGAFEITVPAVDLVTLWASHYWTNADGSETRLRMGNATSDGCTGAPIGVRLARGIDTVRLEITVSDDGTISWTPPIPLTVLVILDRSGQTVWSLVATAPEGPGFSGPVRWGEVPEGARQALPIAGRPRPLASGDVVQLTRVAESGDGVTTLYEGRLEMP